LRAVLLVFVLTSVLAANARARPIRWTVLANGELSVPAGSAEFTDRYGPAGFGGGGGIGANMTSLTITANVYYSYIDLDTDGFLVAEGLTADTSVEGGAANVVYSAIGLRFKFMQERWPRIQPYLLGGLGWYYVFRDEFTVSSPIIGNVRGGSDSEHALGLNAGAGLDIMIDEKVSGFVEGHFQIGFTQETTSTIPVRVGLAYLLGRTQ